jgi:hypothetical protein
MRFLERILDALATVDAECKFNRTIRRRKSLSDNALAQQIAPGNPSLGSIAIKVREIFAGVIGCPADVIYPSDDFGWNDHPMSSERLIEEIQSQFGITISEFDAEDTRPNVQALSLLVERLQPESDAMTAPKRPRFRFSQWTLLLLGFLVCLGLWFSVRALLLEKLARHHQHKAEDALYNFYYRRPINELDALGEAENKRRSDAYGAIGRWHRELAQQYRWSIWLPWIHVEPDSTEPTDPEPYFPPRPGEGQPYKSLKGGPPGKRIDKNPVLSR